VPAPFFYELSNVAGAPRRDIRHEAKALRARVDRAERPRSRAAVESLRSKPNVKGGTDTMAKKAATGAKKKGGKKR
jgi:hypothetical protein